MKFQVCAYFEDLFNESKEQLFPCLQRLILTLGGLGQFSKGMQTLDYVSSLHVSLEFSQPAWCLDEVL